jgi:hypothetical protein
MPGLVPGIHVFPPASIVVKQGVDGRDKPGHDLGWARFIPSIAGLSERRRELDSSRGLVQPSTPFDACHRTSRGCPRQGHDALSVIDNNPIVGIYSHTLLIRGRLLGTLGRRSRVRLPPCQARNLALGRLGAPPGDTTVSPPGAWLIGAKMPRKAWPGTEKCRKWSAERRASGDPDAHAARRGHQGRQSALHPSGFGPGEERVPRDLRLGGDRPRGGRRVTGRPQIPGGGALAATRFVPMLARRRPLARMIGGPILDPSRFVRASRQPRTKPCPASPPILRISSPSAR